MESLIKKYRRVDFVLLHAGYPYVRETGIMASLYENVWVDFGLIFPMLSRMGQQVRFAFPFGDDLANFY